MAAAQDPVRLPTVVVTAPAMPGPRILTGVVRDTGGIEIDGVEIIIPGLRRHVYSNADGIFRFDDIPKGKHTIRARKFGYAPQIREFVVDTAGGLAEFELLPIPRALPPMVTSAERGGLSGVVGDTAFQTLPGAFVRLLGGSGMHTETDSLGTFFMPVEAGTYMVSISKPGFTDRVVGVTIPRDSGRRIQAWLQPQVGKIPVREFHNIDDLRFRLAWRSKTQSTLYTRADFERLEFRTVYDAVNSTHAKNLSTQYSYDCNAMVNGGPATTSIAWLSLDEVETLEIYPAGHQIRTTVARDRPNSQSRPSSLSNTNRANIQNSTRICPTIYVWLR